MPLAHRHRQAADPGGAAFAELGKLHRGAGAGRRIRRRLRNLRRARHILGSHLGRGGHPRRRLAHIHRAYRWCGSGQSRAGGRRRRRLGDAHHRRRGKPRILAGVAESERSEENRAVAVQARHHGSERHRDAVDLDRPHGDGSLRHRRLRGHHAAHGHLVHPLPARARGCQHGRSAGHHGAAHVHETAGSRLRQHRVHVLVRCRLPVRRRYRQHRHVHPGQRRDERRLQQRAVVPFQPQPYRAACLVRVVPHGEVAHASRGHQLRHERLVRLRREKRR